MNKNSELFLLILIGLALLAAYLSFFPLPAPTMFGRFLGLGAFFLLGISLLIGPLVVFWPARFAQWIEPRRAVGISAFVFLGLHFLLELVNYFSLDWGAIFTDLKTWIAVPALVIFFAMTATSTDSMVRRFGPKNWKILQRMTYLAFALTMIHFVLSANGLFITVNSKVFVNLAEIALLVFAVIVVGFQLAGFWVKKSRETTGQIILATENSPNNEKKK